MPKAASSGFETASLFIQNCLIFTSKSLLCPCMLVYIGVLFYPPSQNELGSPRDECDNSAASRYHPEKLADKHDEVALITQAGYRRDHEFEYLPGVGAR